MNDRNIPWSDLLRNFFARKPKDVDGVANSSCVYYREKLLRLIYQRYVFEDFPEKWEKDYFYDHLFIDGLLGVKDTSAGVLALKCGATGINLWDDPTTLVFANPVLGNFEGTIGVDCEEIKICRRRVGVMEIVNRYATLLAMCDSGIAVNLMNTKLAYVFGATSKTQAETFKALFDRVSCGEPAVFTNNSVTNSLREQMFIMPAKQNFIADDIQLLKRKILNEFLTDIGINNTNLEKRERLTDDEVNANNDEVLANIYYWYDNISESLDKVNKMFNLNIKCYLRTYGEEEQNESAKSDRLL